MNEFPKLEASPQDWRQYAELQGLTRSEVLYEVEQAFYHLNNLWNCLHKLKLSSVVVHDQLLTLMHRLSFAKTAFEEE